MLLPVALRLGACALTTSSIAAATGAACQQSGLLLRLPELVLQRCYQSTQASASPAASASASGAAPLLSQPDETQQSPPGSGGSDGASTSTSSGGPWLDASLARALPGLLAPPPPPKPMPLMAALEAAIAGARARFDETIEAHVRLRVDARRGDHMVRGAATLPHGTGRRATIAVFASGAAADAARAAGADVIGDADLAAEILETKGKAIAFDACVATPDMMPALVKLGKILGPKKLMPNPKVGTLTDDVAGAVAALRRGRLAFRMDKAGIVHAGLGRAGQGAAVLYDNMGALAAALLEAKPAVVKGGLPKYIHSVRVTSSMGRGSFPVEVSSLLAAIDAARLKA